MSRRTTAATSWIARLSQAARTIVAPPAQTAASLGSNATLDMQMWLAASPWRPTGAWVVLAGLFSLGWPARPLAIDWQTVALLLLLVDPLWGSLWRLAAGRSELLALPAAQAQQTLWLPYLQPGSPAAQLLGLDESGLLPLLVRVALPGLLLTAAIAAVLSSTALWFTLLVALATLLGWITRRTWNGAPTLLAAVVAIALPWTLTLWQLQPAATSSNTVSLVLIGLWTVHQWGAARTARSPVDWFGKLLLAAAQLGILTLLIIGRAPLWLGILAILFLPTWLIIYLNQPMQRLRIWWLVALLLSALAVGQAG